jgi:PhnB protein
MQLSPYLFFNGNCEAAFKFYERVLEGKIEVMMPHAGTPAEKNVSPEWAGKILHASMTVEGQHLMASDAPPNHAEKQGGYSLSLSFTDPAKAERIFQCPGRKRSGQNAVPADILGLPFRNARRSVRHPVDDQLRQSRVNQKGINFQTKDSFYKSTMSS